MVEQPQYLIASLREGMCVESHRCRVRDAQSGCECAIIADFIEGREAEIARLYAENEQLRAAMQAAVDTHEGRKDIARLRVALEPFAHTGWMTADTAHTERTVIAHMHPESRYELILSSAHFYRAREALGK